MKMSYKHLRETENEVELTAISETIHKRPPIDEDFKEMSSTEEDTNELIPPLEPGEYNDYEQVLKVLGFGLAHVLILLGTGVALSSDAAEVLSISFALPIIRRPSELAITSWQNGLLSSVIFIGMLIGGYAWGGIADITGRRSTLITSLSVNGLFGALSAFSPNFYVLLFFRFISGIGVGGSLPVIMAYNAEFIQTRYRGPYLGTLSSFWMIGALLCGGFAWALLPLSVSSQSGSYSFHSWRLYLLVSALPSLIGAVVFFFMPESPRFLLEVSKERKAVKVLRNIYNLNNVFRRKNKPIFPVKSIKLSQMKIQQFDANASITFKQRVSNVLDGFREVLKRTVQLFYRNLLRSTSLLLIIYFCLSFGSYGVTLWYPTYVDRLSREALESSTEQKDCNHTFSNYTVVSNNIESVDRLFCACPKTDYHNVTLDNITLDSWWAFNGSMTNTIFRGGKYKEVWFEDVSMNTVSFDSVTFDGFYVTNSTWSDVVFKNVTFKNTVLCLTDAEDVSFTNNSTLNGLLLSGIIDNNWSLLNSSCTDQRNSTIPPICNLPQGELDLSKEYFYDFLIAGSAFPGNVVSAIAVYIFRRSYWLAFSLLMSTVSVFLLFFVHTEVYAVLILCLFKAITIPGWNVTSLIVAEVYPTSLRTTASGVLLLLARIGAIIGTYVFGAFSNTDQISVPILMTAVVLFVSSVASVFLPKTNRKTQLQ